MYQSDGWCWPWWRLCMCAVWQIYGKSEPSTHIAMKLKLLKKVFKYKKRKQFSYQIIINFIALTLKIIISKFWSKPIKFLVSICPSIFEKLKINSPRIVNSNDLVMLENESKISKTWHHPIKLTLVKQKVKNVSKARHYYLT